MNKEFEFLWYFDDENELEFWEWCRHNKEFLELLRLEQFTLNEAVAAQTTMLNSGRKPNVNLAIHCIDLGAFTYHAERAEHSMYQVIADAIGGEILAGPNQPDCLVNGIPVEAKNHTFNQSALSQLNRYMKRYGSKFGFAAAPDIKVKLPEEIFFLRVTFSYKTRRYEVDNKDEALVWLQSLNK